MLHSALYPQVTKNASQETGLILPEFQNRDRETKRTNVIHRYLLSIQFLNLIQFLNFLPLRLSSLTKPQYTKHLKRYFLYEATAYCIYGLFMPSIGCWNTLRSMSHAKVSLSSPDEKKIPLSRKLNTLFETGLSQTTSSHDKSLVCTQCYRPVWTSLDISL